MPPVKELLDRPFQMPVQQSFPVQACIAVVDAQFVQWLLGHAGDDDADGCAKLKSPEWKRLAGAASHAGVQAKFCCIHWYKSHADQTTLPGQVLREAPPESADSGLGRVAALTRDEVRLAQGAACAPGLRACDDGHLLTTIDHLKHHGMQDQLVVDHSAADFPDLARTGPSCAIFTRLVNPCPLLDCPKRPDGDERTPAHRQAPGDGGRRTIGALADLCLDSPDSLDALQRTHLPLNLSRGRDLPLETDRESLLEISHHLGRPLAIPECEAMLGATR